MDAKKSSVSGGRFFHNKAEARKVIAHAIVRFYPAEARCLLNKAYVQAQIVLGKDWQNVLDASEEVLRRICTHCRQLANEELQSVA